MITNFEKITAPLTLEEQSLIGPILRGFKAHTKQNPIKAPDIVAKINKYMEGQKPPGKRWTKFTEARLRKITNYIRTAGLAPVIATSAGYYTTEDKREIERQILSLRERAAAIIACADGMEKFLC